MTRYLSSRFAHLARWLYAKRRAQRTGGRQYAFAIRGLAFEAWPSRLGTAEYAAVAAKAQRRPRTKRTLASKASVEASRGHEPQSVSTLDGSSALATASARGEEGARGPAARGGDRADRDSPCIGMVRSPVREATGRHRLPARTRPECQVPRSAKPALTLAVRVAPSRRPRGSSSSHRPEAWCRYRPSVA